MTGLMADSDDESVADCSALDIGDFAFAANLDFKKLSNNKLFGFEVDDFSDDEIYICGDCEFDDEFDCVKFTCDDNCYCDSGHMSREASSHPADEAG